MLTPRFTVTNFCLLTFIMLASTTALSAIPPVFHQSTPNQAHVQGLHVEPGQVPEGLSGRAWADIQEQLTAGNYHAYQHENGGYISSNPAHGWKIRYAEDGSTTLRPSDGEQAQTYHLGLKLNALGFTELQTLDKPQQIVIDGPIVSYQWNDNLREWWVNSKTGLEQWFQLEHRPAGSQSGQPLKLEMTLDTDLIASQNGNTLNFVNASGTTISYNKLKTWDANGRELPARMQLQAKQLSLIIDDSDALYPLTIDPNFAQQAYLKASNTEADDRFGYLVAVDGDTVVVGAYLEDSNASGINGDENNNSASNAGAAYVFVRSGTTWSQQAYLKASNTDSDDTFGLAVAIFGDTIVVGARGEDGNGSSQSDNSASNAGAAYVFVRSGTTWTQQAYLKAANAGGGDLFGGSVAISGDTLVIGAYAEDSSSTSVNGADNNFTTNSGAAYVFVRSGTVWSQQAYLKASNAGYYDQFGINVDISGDTVVIGANSEDGDGNDPGNNLATNSGAAYVFTRSGTTWSQQAYLKASNVGAGDLFGQAVAIDGDTVVVNAVNEDSNATGINGNQSNNSATSAGAAYVFVRSGTSWSQQAYLKGSNTGTGDQFGWKVAVTGDTIVASAVLEDSNATGVNGDQNNNLASGSGAAYIFTRSGTTWSQQTYLKASNSDIGDQFGRSVSISGDTVVVGAWYEDSNATGINGVESDNSASNSGAVYIFDNSPVDFTIGGTVSGLAGSGLVLQNNAGDDLIINTNGDFTFATPQHDATTYAVTVLTQPTQPSQTCSVSNSNGTVAGANVTDITVTCIENIAYFSVTKEFTDGNNPTPVDVNISCNTGLPIKASHTITEDQGVTFTVTSFNNSELNCTITEQDLNGYTQTYQATGPGPGAITSDGGCLFEAVVGSTQNFCHIVNDAVPVDVSIMTQWELVGTGGDFIDSSYTLTLYCDTRIMGGTRKCPTRRLSKGYCKVFEGEGSDTFVAQVIPQYPSSSCWVSLHIFDDAVETVNNCDNFDISAGSSNSCTITNTVFFEGIPTLNQFGLAILALLMLGVALVGFRRFA